MASLWKPAARIAHRYPYRRNWRKSNSRNGRSPIEARDFGASPVTLRRRVPAPPHRMIASAAVGIDLTPVAGERFVVGDFGFVYDDVAATVRECEGHAQ